MFKLIYCYSSLLVIVYGIWREKYKQNRYLFSCAQLRCRLFSSQSQLQRTYCCTNLIIATGDTSDKLDVLENEAKVLEDIYAKEQQLETCQAQVRMLADGKRSLEVRLAQTQLALDDTRTKLSEGTTRANYLKTESECAKKIWDELYALYYDANEPVDENIAQTMTSDAIEGEFICLKEVV